MVLPLESTDVPGIYRRGSKFVVVYRAEGRQHKQSVTTFAEARAFSSGATPRRERCVAARRCTSSAYSYTTYRDGRPRKGTPRRR
jgi:hypothetical protein